ncbi:LPS export ABC transporter periplasmic protein LptC [Spirosoma sp. KNUC1025]|uniref:LPS export ABC transporter periplasmic protein LptC n=1 Tax=Spirosoma sp. KNUC1025 TaxID=2894082 RepID=UPI00386EB148|nr:LPS export ABC transporter periplasmic protein LptC [Spirosoma sp. KNUC1025]
MNNAQWIMGNEKLNRLGHLKRHFQAVLYFVSLGCFALFFAACEQPKQNKKIEPYKGPIEEINDVKLLYSEAAVLKVRLKTPKQLRYLNEDRKYPKPINIVFYGPAGEEMTTLRSDSGRYIKSRDLYVVTGHVVVINKQKREKLLTSELTWNPATKKVYTDKRVTILSDLTGEKLYGIGLDANQDFTQYAIRKPSGVFNVEGGI